MFVYTVEPFLSTNKLWTVREVPVAQPCDTLSTLEAADVHGRKIVRGYPKPLDQVLRALSYLVDTDDWVDVVYLDGRRDRNVKVQHEN